MQYCYIKETIELSLAGCQPIEFFLSIFCFIYKKKFEAHVIDVSLGLLDPHQFRLRHKELLEAQVRTFLEDYL